MNVEHRKQTAGIRNRKNPADGKGVQRGLSAAVLSRLVPFGTERRSKRPVTPYKVNADASRRGNSAGRILSYDKYRLSIRELLLVLGKSMAVSGLFSYVFYRSMAAFELMLPVSGVFLVLRERRQRLKKRKLLLAQQFKEAMVILAASLSAGYAMENAMAVSMEELKLIYGADGLIVQEFSGMVQQIRTNRNVEQVLLEFAGRSGLEDVQNLAEVLGIGKRTGGDLGSIMRHTAEVTASRQFEQKIMNLIPFFIVFYVEGTSPGFFDQMYRTGMGRGLMTLCLGLYLTAFWLSERILEIEV